MKVITMLVYKITNNINGKIYIGITTTTFSHRISQHKCESRKDRYRRYPLYRAMRKYGEDSFSYEVIEHVDSVNQLKNREIYWIKFYKSNSDAFGYNLRGGGEIPYHSEDSIKKFKLTSINRGNRKNSSTIYRNVVKYKGMFRSSITVNSEALYLGTFKTEIEAAWAYDEAVRKYYSGNGYLNFPDGPTNELKKALIECAEKDINDLLTCDVGVYYCESKNKWRGIIYDESKKRTRIICEKPTRLEAISFRNDYIIKNKLKDRLNFYAFYKELMIAL